MTDAPVTDAQHAEALRKYYAGLPDDYLPRIHVAQVLAHQHISPGMLRIRLGGTDLVDYPTTGVGDEYVRLFFPGESPNPAWPFLSARGWDYADGVEPLQMRTYTIREHRPGEVDIDFVVHDGGIAAAWAVAARPGMEVSLTPPRPMYERPAWARRQILVADEPALPAALRIAELTAHEIETVVVAEMRGVDHQIEADTAASVQYVWLRGSGNGRTPSSLDPVLRRTAVDDATYVWVATETRLSRGCRSYLRHDLGRSADSYQCVGYWTDNAEEWEARYEALGSEIHQQLDDLYESDRDAEEIVDAIFEIYEAAGL